MVNNLLSLDLTMHILTQYLRSILALDLSLQCTRLLKEELDKPQPEITDSMIATVINMAKVELTWGEDSKSRNHLNGLMAMVKHRGGLQELELAMGTHM